MFRKPRFAASARVFASDGQLVIVDHRRSLVLDGAVFGRLAPLLTGELNVGEIAAALAADLPVTQIYAALNQLAKRGLVVEGDAAPRTPREALLERWRSPHPPGMAAAGATVGGPPADTARAVMPPWDGSVHLRSIGADTLSGTAEAWLREKLVADGCGLDNGPDSLLVVVTDDYLHRDLSAVNEEQLAKGRPWVLVKPGGLVPWIGPLLVPGRTGCWECLRQRLRANRQMEQYIQTRRGTDDATFPSRVEIPAGTELACALASLALLQWSEAGAAGRVEGRLITLDLARMVTDEHVLVLRPQCRACGDAGIVRRRALEAVRCTSRPKRFRADGGHRTQTPDETFAALRHHISPILGAVSELVPAIGQRHPLTPCFVAGHNFSMGIESIAFLRESLRGMSGGKGASEIQAKVSGLCEAIERYSGLYRGDEHHRRGSLKSLGTEAIHPNDCMGFSESQFAQRDEWNRTQPSSRCLVIPRRFEPDQEIEWTPLWSLTSECHRYLPSAFCYYGHPEFSGRWCNPDSNGCAAGNTREEAILQGYMELVERDAVALWWYNRVRRRGVDWASFQLPYLTAIQEYYATIEREIWALDITSDLGIPTIACVSVRRNAPSEDILVGFGSHFDVRIAMLRAITEVNQFLPSVSRRRPDGTTMYLFGDELARRWWTTARLTDNNYLVPLEDQPPVRLQDFPDESTDDLQLDVLRCIETTRRHGMELLVLDQTQPDIGLHVVKVVVPELCHFWRRLGKSRLYDAPVLAGWLPHRYAEDELNPHTIFF